MLSWILEDERSRFAVAMPAARPARPARPARAPCCLPCRACLLVVGVLGSREHNFLLGRAAAQWARRPVQAAKTLGMFPRAESVNIVLQSRV